MMTLKEFVIKYYGEPLEVVDNTNKNQCFDLAIGWCRDGLGLPTNIFSGLLNAFQIFTTPTKLAKENFDFIANTPQGSPKEGDLVVWSNKYGPAGHVALATGIGNTKVFEAFSQNDPLGSLCVLRTYKYDNVLGWLRPKNYKPEGHTDEECTKIKAENFDLKKSVQDLTDDIINLEQKVQLELNTHIQKVGEINTKLDSALKEVDRLALVADTLFTENTQLKEKLNEGFDKFSGYELIVVGIKKVLGSIKRG